MMRSPKVMALALTAATLMGPDATAGQSLSLAAALDSAFATHPVLARAQALEVAAAESVSSSRASRWPTLGLQMSLTRFEEPMLSTPIHAFDPNLLPDFDRTLLQGQLRARYTLLDWGGRSGAIGAAEAGASAARAATRGTRARLIEGVTEAYLRLRTARAQDEAAQARIAALTEELNRAERAFAEGTAAAVERLRASVALQDAEAARTQTHGAVRLAESTLARLMGTPVERVAGAALDPALPRPPAPDLPATSPGRDIGSPTVEEAARRAEAARAAARGQRAGWYPRLELHGGLLQYGTLDRSPDFEWQAGVQLSWDVFAGGARRAGVRRADAQVRAAERDLETIRMDVETAEESARTAMVSADARVAALEASVAQWEELVEVEALGLEAGAGTQSDLLDAEAGLYAARAGLAEATSEAFLARIRLAAAQGNLDRDWMDRMSGGS